jgi:hypothetical protein
MTKKTKPVFGPRLTNTIRMLYNIDTTIIVENKDDGEMSALIEKTDWTLAHPANIKVTFNADVADMEVKQQAMPIPDYDFFEQEFVKYLPPSYSHSFSDDKGGRCVLIWAELFDFFKSMKEDRDVEATEGA